MNQLISYDEETTRLHQDERDLSDGIAEPDQITNQRQGLRAALSLRRPQGRQGGCPVQPRLDDGRGISGGEIGGLKTKN